MRRLLPRPRAATFPNRSQSCVFPCDHSEFGIQSKNNAVNFWPNPRCRRIQLLPGRFQVFLGQRHPWSLMIKEKAGDPEASVSMHNLERIDASREWLGVGLRIPDFGRAPHLDKIAKLLEAVGDAALEETVRLEVGIVLLREHVGSQENGIALACRCILRGRRLRNN